MRPRTAALAYFGSIIATGAATGAFLALLLLRFFSGSLLTAMGDACGGIFAAGHGFLAESNWNYLLAAVIFSVFLSQLAFLFGGGTRLFRVTHREKRRRQSCGLSCPALRTISEEKWAAHISLIPGDLQLDAATVGLFRPRIVLSEGIVKSLPGRELVAVAAHEEGHRSARDNLLITAAKSVATTLFYLPGPKRALLEMRKCLERSADRSAAAASGDRFAIAEALARIASMNYSEADSHSPLVTAVRGNGDLVARLEELVGDERHPGHGWARLALLVAGAVVVLGIFASSALAVAGADHREAFICYTQHTQSTGPEDVCDSGHPSH
ncbi:MAG: M48 family metalloprotease [Thermoleophilia bacterium]|nr:M48 family metalloprotease [Thermoleophilia bacterium]